jgi:uncharacterized protein (TIGR02391 family)
MTDIWEKQGVYTRLLDLQRRITSALENQDNTLINDFYIEYVGLLKEAMIQWGPTSELTELDMALTLFTTNWAKPKAKDLSALKWFSNTVHRLIQVVKPSESDIAAQEMDFHTLVQEHSMPLFRDGYYRQAVFEAFRLVEEHVRKKSGDAQTGTRLMTRVFDPQRPMLRIRPSLSETAQEEQEGFKFLFMGSMLGIRNPKAHSTVKQIDAPRTLQYLAFASLLLKTVDDAEVVNADRPE